MRSNRAFCQAAGPLRLRHVHRLDAADRPRTATARPRRSGRIAGFGGAPNMGADARGRRHASAGLAEGRRAKRAAAAAQPRCRAARSWSCRWSRPSASTCSRRSSRRLDAWALAEQAGMALPPIMIYGDDVTHILTEEGIANLLLCRSDEEREQAIRGVAGYTPVGLARDRRMVENLRDRGVIRRAEDLGIDKRDGDARPARRALDQRSGARVGRPVRAADALSQLVRSDDERWKRLQLRLRRRPQRGAAASRRCWSASSAPATSRCWSSRAGERRLPRRRRDRRRAASARSGRRCCATSTRAIRWPACASRSTTWARRPPW